MSLDRDGEMGRTIAKTRTLIYCREWKNVGRGIPCTARESPFLRFDCVVSDKMYLLLLMRLWQ